MCPGEHGSGLILPAHGGVGRREFSIPFFQTVAWPLSLIWRPLPVSSFSSAVKPLRAVDKGFLVGRAVCLGFSHGGFTDGGQGGAQLLPCAPSPCSMVVCRSPVAEQWASLDKVNNSGQWRFTLFWATFLRSGGHFSPTCLFLTSKMNVLI